MKGKAKLLRFLEGGPAKSEAMHGGPAGIGTMLLRSDGARLLSVQLEACRSDGLVIGEAAISITDPGRAWLRRHAARQSEAPFAEQHRSRTTRTVERAGKQQTVSVDRHHSALSRLSLAKDRDGHPWVNSEGIEAGERFARDFEIGGLRQRVTSSWDPMPRSGRSGAGGQAELKDTAIDARSRLDQALARLGPDLGGVALDICCFAKGTSEVERDRRWPPRSAKLMLRTALDLLSRHYGLRTGEAAGSLRTRRWRAS